jgi:hypothetical protein
MSELDTKNQEKSQQTVLNKSEDDVEVPFDCRVQDYLFSKLPDWSELIFLQTLIPFGLLYLLYLLGNKEIYTLFVKYLVVLLGIRYIYRLLKTEPHPSKKNKYNMALSGQFMMLILILFIIAEYRLIDLKTFQIGNLEIGLNNIVSNLLIWGYGILTILTRSNYSVDVLNTYFLTFSLYQLKFFGF